MKKYGSEVKWINNGDKDRTKKEIDDAIQKCQDMYEDFKLITVCNLGEYKNENKLAFIFEYWDEPREEEV